MLGIELISTRRRQQLEAAERDLGLPYIRGILKQVIRFLDDERKFTKEIDRDESLYRPAHLTQLEALLFNCKTALFKLNGEKL